MNEIEKIENIQNRIFSIRGKQIMLDRDLAGLYEVSTKRINEQVKRNIKRFPDIFRFQLSNIEKSELVANCDRFKNLKHSTVNLYAFTEQGVAMLSSVLHSEKAIKISLQIMQAFVEMRKFISINANVFARLDSIEHKQIIYKKETDEKFNHILDALETKELQPKQGIFYNGQIFDAYKLIGDIIRAVKHSIIYTKKISKMLKQDLDKHNAQYLPIKIMNHINKKIILSKAFNN